MRVWYGNNVLDGLTRGSSRAIHRQLEKVDLVAGQVLHATNEPGRSVYFPASGLVTLLARNKRGERLAVGMVGSSGVVGAADMLGAGSLAFTDAVVQVPGQASRPKTR